jgi:hypothetical protein
LWFYRLTPGSKKKGRKEGRKEGRKNEIHTSEGTVRRYVYFRRKE